MAQTKDLYLAVGEVGDQSMMVMIKLRSHIKLVIALLTNRSHWRNIEVPANELRPNTNAL